MKVGVHCYRYTVTGGSPAIGPTLARLGEAAESAGVDTISVMDHWFQMEPVGGPDLPMLEGYTTLGFLAGHTRTVHLQLLVTGVTYRHPGLLAKTVTALDVLSGGRAVLGIGAAWYEREHLGLGVAFPPVAERFERLEESIQICLQLWSDDDGPYEGTHYRLAETLNNPQCLTKPHPPIMIGGTGERKTLRLVAQYADACNLFAGPDNLDDLKHKLEVLAGHCADVGRDYDRIKKTVLWGPEVLPDEVAGREFVAQAAAVADLGVDTVFLRGVYPDPVAFVEGLGRHVTPRLADLA